MQDPLEDQPPERLEVIAEYASDLAAWKRAKRKQELEQKRAEEAVDENELEGLEERDVSTDSEATKPYLRAVPTLPRRRRNLDITITTGSGVTEGPRRTSILLQSIQNDERNKNIPDIAARRRANPGTPLSMCS